MNRREGTLWPRLGFSVRFRAPQLSAFSQEKGVWMVYSSSLINSTWQVTMILDLVESLGCRTCNVIKIEKEGNVYTHGQS